MKKDIHPKGNLIKVYPVNNGEPWEMISTNKNDCYLTMAKENHPAWTGVQSIAQDNQKVIKMNKFFKTN